MEISATITRNNPSAKIIAHQLSEKFGVNWKSALYRLVVSKEKHKAKKGAHHCGFIFAGEKVFHKSNIILKLLIKYVL